MIKKPVVVQITAGTEDRPVALIVQMASQYESKIYLETENKRINAKSIMGMMTLRLVQGESLTVSAEGEDEERAAESLEKYLTGQTAS